MEKEATAMYNPLRPATIERISMAQASTLPLSRDAEIRNAEQIIRAIENLRHFHFTTGDLYAARLHAIRLGVKRSELRRLLG